jgi:hypothetical protein
MSVIFRHGHYSEMYIEGSQVQKSHYISTPLFNPLPSSQLQGAMDELEMQHKSHPAVFPRRFNSCRSQESVETIHGCL